MSSNFDKTHFPDLIPYDQINDLHKTQGYEAGMPRPTLQITPAVAEVLSLGISAMASRLQDVEINLETEIGRRCRAELVTRIYVTFIENLSDDHAEDKPAKELRDAATCLLGVMY
jgi:hypothetical protein